jgi:coenzyme F420-reducing hydrogenase gamma subunit
MNSIEERDNLILLLQEALKFYANPNNYKGHASASCCGGTPFSLIEMDEGSQARFALDKAKQMVDINLKMQDEYDKLVTEGLLTNMEDVEQIMKDNDKDIR